MIGYEEIVALADVSRETSADADAARAWAESAGYDVDGVIRAANEFAVWWLGFHMSQSLVMDLNRALSGAFAAGFEIGVRAESLRAFREEIGEL